MNKKITVTVQGEYITLSSRVAGAAGSYKATDLCITFDEQWSDTSKKLYMTDAMGENPVEVTLTADLLTDGVYIVPVPGEPLAYPGDMTLTIEGKEITGAVTNRVVMAATTTMQVLTATVPESTQNPDTPPTPTELEQIQAEVDNLIESIGDATQAKADAEAAAVAAEGSETAAAGSATSAAGSAATATTKASEAASSASGAATSASAATSAKNAAAISATTAQTAAETATAKATAAVGSATSASNSATTATQKATAAELSAESAQGSATTATTQAGIATTKAAEAAQSASDATGSAQTATDKATLATQKATAAEGSAQEAATSAQSAQDAQEAIENMTATAATGDAGTDVKVEKTEVEGVVNLKFTIPSGDTGPQGPAGDDMDILALYGTLTALETAHPTGSKGDYYAVGTSESNVIYFWDVDALEWTSLGALQGASGATFTPSVDDDGDISWTNDKGMANPETQNIKGPTGDSGVYIGDDEPTDPDVNVWIPNEEVVSPLPYEVITADDYDALETYEEKLYIIADEVET